MQAAQSQALERRLQLAEVDLTDLLVSRRDNIRPATPEEEERSVRAYRGQPARAETTSTMTVCSARNEGAIAAIREYLSWQVYVTNQSAEQFSLEQTVLAYRAQYLVEHPIGRLKVTPLSLSPVYLSRDEHVTELVHLLALGMRVVCALKYKRLSRFVVSCVVTKGGTGDGRTTVYGSREKSRGCARFYQPDAGGVSSLG